MKENNQSKTPQIETEKDWLLQNMVNAVNSVDATIGITLTTHGFLLSGFLIGGRHYLKEHGKLMASTCSDDKIADELVLKYEELAKDIYKEGESLDTDPVYLHIKDPKFFDSKGNSIPSSSKDLYWRGRISEISGFTLGVLRDN